MSARKPGWYWPWVIVGVIALQASVILVTVYIAVGPESRAVEPDYYQQALEWDEQAAERRTPERLGWTVAFDVADPQGPFPQRTLEATLTDADGPIEDATVKAVLFPTADAGSRTEVPLVPAGEGRYRAEATMTHKGLWEIRLTIERGEDRALVIEHADLG